VFVRYY